MEFRRINGLPPYVFATINELRDAARHDGRDVIDLGFGNPDLPSPDVAVEKLAEAAAQPAQPPLLGQPGHPEDPPGHLRPLPAQVRRGAGPRHRGGHHHRGQGGPVPPDVGAARAGRHRARAVARPTRSTSTPRCSPAPTSAMSASTPRAARRVGSAEGGAAFFDNLMEAWESAWPKPRVVVLSFPHNPTTECVDLAWMTRLVEFAQEHDIVLVHDFAYADIAFDGYTPPSILQVPGAKDVAVELYTMTKSFSMAGWRVGFLVGNAEIVQALTKLKSYLDYGTFQPIQIAAIVAMNEAPDYPKVINEIYQSRRDALCDGLNRIGWEVTPPRGTMFVWAPIPEPYQEMGSLEFAKFLVEEADVATSPGVGFGPGGDGHVRFALIENEQRIGQGVRSLRKALTRLR